jgi:hypothetical protein
VEVEVEAVLYGGAVDLGDKPASVGKPRAVDPDPLADGCEFGGGVP